MKLLTMKFTLRFFVYLFLLGYVWHHAHWSIAVLLTELVGSMFFDQVEEALRELEERNT